MSRPDGQIIPRSHIRARAKERPRGYAEELERLAIYRDENLIVLDFVTYHELRVKWQQWERTRSRGLGDTIAKLTKAVGLKPCGGCRKRQAKLNQLVPYTT